MQGFEDFDHKLKTIAETEEFTVICWMLAWTGICSSLQVQWSFNEAHTEIAPEFTSSHDGLLTMDIKHFHPK